MAAAAPLKRTVAVMVGPFFNISPLLSCDGLHSERPQAGDNATGHIMDVRKRTLSLQKRYSCATIVSEDRAA